MTIEAMRLALEALEHEAQISNDNAYERERTLLRAAIEQAEKQSVCARCGGIVYDPIILQQAEKQERSEQWWKHEVSNAWAEGYEKGRAQREWVGLTEYEVGFLTVFDGLHDVEVPLLANFIRHIEAKLKGKNA